VIWRNRREREEDQRRTEAAAVVTEAIRMRVATLTQQLHAELERLGSVLAEQLSNNEGARNDQ
jgi:hypothetical protein